MKIQTHYDNLKVSRDAPLEVIRAAYKSLSQKYHPDRNPNDAEAARIMSLINSSYDVLSNPEKRRKHDLWIASQETNFEKEVPEWMRRPPHKPEPDEPEEDNEEESPSVITPRNADLETSLRGWFVFLFVIFIIVIANYETKPKHNPVPYSQTVLEQLKTIQPVEQKEKIKLKHSPVPYLKPVLEQQEEIKPLPMPEPSVLETFIGFRGTSERLHAGDVLVDIAMLLRKANVAEFKKIESLPLQKIAVNQTTEIDFTHEICLGGFSKTKSLEIKDALLSGLIKTTSDEVIYIGTGYSCDEAFSDFDKHIRILSFAGTPSYDCREAQIIAEKLICGNKELAKLDVSLSEIYHKIQDKPSFTEELFIREGDLIKTQQAWMKRRNACNTTSCIESAYYSRIKELCIHVPESCIGER